MNLTVENLRTTRDTLEALDIPLGDTFRRAIMRISAGIFEEPQQPEFVSWGVDFTSQKLAVKDHERKLAQWRLDHAAWKLVEKIQSSHQ